MAPLAVVAAERRGRTEISLLSAGLSASSASGATISVMGVFPLRIFWCLSERFGIYLKANLKAAAPSLSGGLHFFGQDSPV